MRCLRCNQYVESGSVTCSKCGSLMFKVLESTKPISKEKFCAQCGKKVSKDARFCNYCGAKFVSEATDVFSNLDKNKFDYSSNYITWRILPGQIAVKVDEEEISAYKTVKGIYIAPGTKALFFVDGKYTNCLDSGKYAFNTTKEIIHSGQQEENGVVKFMKGIAQHISNGVASLFGIKRNDTPKIANSIVHKSIYTIVLVRNVEFPLIFNFDNVNTKGVRSDVGLHLMCKITNLNSFFESELVDKRTVATQTLAESLYPVLKLCINDIASKYAPDEFNNNDKMLNNALSVFDTKAQNIYPYLSITSILNLTSECAEIEELRAKREQLYVDELNLKQLQEKNDYINRLQSVEHSQELAAAKEYVDFRALMDKVDEEGMLNEAKKEQYAYMLKAQNDLANATTDNEKENAIRKLQQTELLSQEEIDSLKAQIEQRTALGAISNEHALSMAILHNKIDEDKEALRWETEVGNRILADELNKKRMSAEFSDERREADLEFEKKKMSNKMDLLRQAQELREERERAQHSRNMEMQKSLQEHDLEKYKITAGMTFEQIMASNPNITPEAAMAFAKKFEAEQVASANDKNAELQRMHNEDLKEILARQFALTESVISAQKQNNEKALQEKQSELDRVHLDSERNQDRFLSGMQTTMRSMTGISKSNDENTVFCPQCGKSHKLGVLFCDNCGATM